MIRFVIECYYQDADILRFCCDFTRPTLTERAKGKVAYGKISYRIILKRALTDDFYAPLIRTVFTRHR
jgi:hypothetical protein